MTKIDVSDARAGVIVMNGLIGNCYEMFEIRVCEGTFRYWVRDKEVPVEVYRDALQLAVLDRFVPGDTSGTFMPQTDEDPPSDPD